MFRRGFLGILLVLWGFGGPAWAAAPKKLLLVGTGPDGHPPQTHEYMAGLKILERCLKGGPGLEVTTVKAVGAWPEGPELMQRADGLVLFVSGEAAGHAWACVWRGRTSRWRGGAGVPTVAAPSASAACTSTPTGAAKRTAAWWRRACSGRSASRSPPPARSASP